MYRTQYGFVKGTADENEAKNTTLDGPAEGIITPEDKAKHSGKAPSGKVDKIRLDKWMKMLEDYPDKVHFKLKKRARKGIPDSYRATAWKILT